MNCDTCNENHPMFQVLYKNQVVLEESSIANARAAVVKLVNARNNNWKFEGLTIKEVA